MKKADLSSAPAIVILLPMVWSVRNVVHSGVLDQLSNAGMRVFLLMREYSPHIIQHDSFASATGCERLIMPIRKRRVKGRSLLRDALSSAHSRRNQIESYSIYQRWFTRYWTQAQRRREKLVEALGAVLQSPKMFRMACCRHQQMYLQEYDLTRVKEQLHWLNPDLVWSTANVEPLFEPAYVMSARALSIPIVTSILSFDNLSSKSTHLNYLAYDHYLVWNERMRNQLLQFFPQISKDQVAITGTPQFDFHRRPEYLWSREKTLSQLGLPPGARYFLYTTSVASLAPAEPEVVSSLANKIQSDPLLKNYWLVVRRHPKDKADRWAPVLDISGKVVLSNPWSTPVNSEADYWAISTRDDQGRFVSSLAHCEACLNIASTTALDAAVLDRPVIGIRFDNEPQAPSEILYEEYDATHYRPLVESGGLRVAHNWNGLITLMHSAIDNPATDHAERARMVELECGQVDGQAAHRVATALVTFLNKA